MAKTPEKLDEKEAQQRFEAALKGALKSPHESLKEKPKVRGSRPKKANRKKKLT